MPRLEVVKEIMRQYPLCDSCLGRQFPSELKGLDNASKGNELKRQVGVTEKAETLCYVCGGLLSSIERYADLILNTLKDYEFNSFVIGARISISLTENEDHLRAETKLRGGDTIKTNFTGELSRTVSRRLGVIVKHRLADVTMVVDTIIDHVEVYTRPIYLYGRYIKMQRGISQKKRRCKECIGEGCPKCNLSGYVVTDSVEQRLAKPLLTIFKAGRIKFTWIGGEDSNSLVSGRGRPFYAEVSEPMIRKPPDIKTIFQEVNSPIVIKDISITDPPKDRSFAVTVRSDITLDRPVTSDDAKSLEASLTGSYVTVTTPGKKTITRRIISLTIESLEPQRLRLRMKCDGGLSIRRFLTGEGGEVKPNIATVLDRSVVLDKAAPFDILDVDFKGQ
jgi:tRNA pseudouridine synthase 10